MTPNILSGHGKRFFCQISRSAYTEAIAPKSMHGIKRSLQQESISCRSQRFGLVRVFLGDNDVLQQVME